MNTLSAWKRHTFDKELRSDPVDDFSSFRRTSAMCASVPQLKLGDRKASRAEFYGAPHASS